VEPATGEGPPCPPPALEGDWGVRLPGRVVPFPWPTSPSQQELEEELEEEALEEEEEEEPGLGLPCPPPALEGEAWGVRRCGMARLGGWRARPGWLLLPRWGRHPWSASAGTTWMCAVG
jgi:hypothetical protein